MKPSRLVVEDLPISMLHINPRNARTHPKSQIRQIAESIGEFGFTSPILIDEQNRIIAGHGRVEAAELLGLEAVPVVRVAGLGSAQIRALALADNKIAENAGWNLEILAEELEFLSQVEIDVEASVTGFSSAEIDLVIEGAVRSRDDPTVDQVPKIVEGDEVVVRSGDLWLLGKNRLVCGDARKEEFFAKLMAGAEAQLIFIDPPYNRPIRGNVSGLGAICHNDFVMAAGELTEPEFVQFLETVCHHLANHSVDGSIHFVCMDWRHLSEVLEAGKRCYDELKNICVWCKSNGGMGSLYRGQHELVLVYKSGTAPHINNIELGRHGRNRTNVWDYPGVNTFRDGRLDELRMHPTVKPAALVADAILDCSKRGDIVLDCFVGSGTTLIAAEMTGRRAYAMEIDPVYAQTAILRWQNHTGGAAVLASSGETLADVVDRQEMPSASAANRGKHGEAADVA